ncbi:hypothetical protein [Paraflavitalea sp. CAU 1676]|uniref:hypothetical protein n=1 Tax=Paraflavitalea sp. CAU 1676 TaxID=3032598 RepID=UPI0023DCC328|nr:hypothetical protein [Paraflavitalea sp. CAU 1676]MDF2192162.1 hypothetical protein [Paraflavitalea sp. CAU 1676]
MKLEYLTILLNGSAESLTREMVSKIPAQGLSNADELASLLLLIDKKGVEPIVKADLILQLRCYMNEELEERLLYLLLAGTDHIVRKQIVSVLMQTGSKRVLAALEKTKQDPLLEFVHTVISHRLGLTPKYFKAPTSVQKQLPLQRSRSFKSGLLAPETSSKIIGEVNAGTFNLGSFDPGGVQIECINNDTVVMFHKETVGAGFSYRMGKPSVIGAIVRRSEEHDRWTYSRMILAGPLEKEQCYVAVYRRNGVCDLFGTGLLQQRTIELHTVRQAGNANMIVRVYWHGGSAVIAGIVDLIKNPARTPIPLTSL